MTSQAPQKAVFYLLLALLLSGAFAYFQLPQKEDPDFTFKVMTITLCWPGATLLTLSTCRRCMPCGSG